MSGRGREKISVWRRGSSPTTRRLVKRETSFLATAELCRQVSFPHSGPHSPKGNACLQISSGRPPAPRCDRRSRPFGRSSTRPARPARSRGRRSRRSRRSWISAPRSQRPRRRSRAGRPRARPSRPGRCAAPGCPGARSRTASCAATGSMPVLDVFLSSGQVRTLQYLICRTGRGHAFTTLTSWLAADLGWHVRTIQVHLRALRLQGYILTSAPDPKTHKITITLTARCEVAPPQVRKKTGPQSRGFKRGCHESKFVHR